MREGFPKGENDALPSPGKIMQLEEEILKLRFQI